MTHRVTSERSKVFIMFLTAASPLPYMLSQCASASVLLSEYVIFPRASELMNRHHSGDRPCLRPAERKGSVLRKWLCSFIHRMQRSRSQVISRSQQTRGAHDVNTTQCQSYSSQCWGLYLLSWSRTHCSVSSLSSLTSSRMWRMLADGQMVHFW